MSNSRVESHNRAELRNRIISAATLLEILLSGLVLIGLLLSMIPLLQWMPGLLFDGNDVEVSIFLQRALDIVIGIEFIKMLAKHSPGSSLEVLLYAIARHMVVGHESALENLLSVGAIALIFVVRKFFFVPAFGAHLPDGHPAPDLTPSQSGIPEDEFAARLRKHLSQTTKTPRRQLDGTSALRGVAFCGYLLLCFWPKRYSLPSRMRWILVRCIQMTMPPTMAAPTVQTTTSCVGRPRRRLYTSVSTG